MGQRPSKSKSKPSSAQSIVHPQLAPTASLRDVLAQERLGAYEQLLVEKLGVSSEADLALLTEEDVNTLGLRPVERRRLLLRIDSARKQHQRSDAPTVVTPSSKPVPATAVAPAASSTPRAEPDPSSPSERSGDRAAAGAAAILSTINAAEAGADAVAGELTESTTTVAAADGTVEETAEVISTYSGVLDLPETARQVLGGLFSAAEEAARYLPGAKLVLHTCVAVHERFQARRELSANMSAALDLTRDVARHVAQAGQSLKDRVDWAPCRLLSTRWTRSLKRSPTGGK